MKQKKYSKNSESYPRKKLDSYDYDDFDDDYYEDVVQDRKNSQSKRHRPPRRNARHDRALNDYGKDY
ncbi:MAG: hypothetical protein KDF58_03740 [Alphaproteobacteria bacterium]|nr:hypothetical protein [Alphaproteobacteria bacterium]HPF46758.1 hypothetical protein [Emcibacteraceae bacterium]HRW30437.1 hypothetical protein [Emcibacteraceae bacterium]